MAAATTAAAPRRGVAATTPSGIVSAERRGRRRCRRGGPRPQVVDGPQRALEVVAPARAFQVRRRRRRAGEDRGELLLDVGRRRRRPSKPATVRAISVVTSRSVSMCSRAVASSSRASGSAGGTQGMTRCLPMLLAVC